MGMFLFGDEKTCANCGRVFYVFNPEDYTYRKRLGRQEKERFAYFCGWNCMNAWEKTHKSVTPRLVRK